MITANFDVKIRIRRTDLRNPRRLLLAKTNVLGKRNKVPFALSLWSCHKLEDHEEFDRHRTLYCKSLQQKVHVCVCVCVCVCVERA
jgi:hypothetical protein